MSDNIIHSLYFDTNALKVLSFGTETATLLNESKAGRLEFIISEWTLYEWSRQYYQDNFENQPDSRENRLIKIGTINVEVIYKAFKKCFENYNVRIIPHSYELDEAAEILIKDNSSYFKSDDINDRRDALIYVAAERNIQKDKTIVLCQENDLREVFRGNGFIVKDNSRTFLKELFGDFQSQNIEIPDIIGIIREPDNDNKDSFLRTLKKVDPKYADGFSEPRTLPQNRNNVAEILNDLSAIDAEVRLNILGYTKWLSPLSKKDLHTLLNSKGYEEGVIENNANRLVIEKLLADTGNHWITDNKTEEAEKIYDQAMASVMPGILETIGLT